MFPEIKLVSDFDENLYLTYPHNNGFADGGQSLILGRNTEHETGLWKCGLDGERLELCRFERQTQLEKLIWFDVARESDTIVTVADKKLWLIDPAGAGKPQLIFAAPAGKWLHGIPGVSADGRRVVVAIHGAESYEAVLIDLPSGEKRTLFEKPWMVDHFHFCPFDPDWIGFSHEGFYATVMDRVWAWHASEAPEGRCIFDQKPDEPARTLYVGHERWSFHDRSVMIVAYGDGPGEPRGVYEAFVDGRQQRLVSEGNRDMHLDVSRDGRWVVIDTSGPFDLPGKGWENAQGVSDILVADRATGERRYVARSRILQHPSHPHPTFTPDGRKIFYNEASEDGSRNRIWCADNPFLV